ncbi:MAG: hypothetical protein HY023_02435, partial [Chloroflexi bacterium]|nr:hypothetical protein [Chloroflexota bacterium]
MVRRLLFVVLAFGLATACAPAPPPASPTSAPTQLATRTPALPATPLTTETQPPPSHFTETPAPPPTPLPTLNVIGPAQTLVAATTQDLALRTAVDPSAITVIEVTSQFWPDTSMGCPEAGKLYSQIIVEGYRIVL